MTYTVRAATPEDVDAILTLLPRLADFSLPPQRVAEDLWRGDAELLLAWSRGHEPDCLVWVAVNSAETVLGTAIVRLREELLSHAPSAHLEVLVVRAGAEGQGIGKTLLQTAEHAARERGALSMSLHVFANNDRARAVYEQRGFEGELLRYIKHFASANDKETG